ncbi:MAG: hypothetical protein RIK87_17975 [Fuerstiella sp.]
MSSYAHTQRGWIHWICYIAAVVMFAGSAATGGLGSPVPGIVLLASGALCAVLGLGVQALTVSDGGDRLLVAFGPLPLFRTSISYAEIAEVTVGRTRWIDGWGLHYVPGRGWTYNINGWDCVEIRRSNGRLLRVGTDEPQRLASVIRDRISSRPE